MKLEKLLTGILSKMITFDRIVVEPHTTATLTGNGNYSR